MVLAWIDRRKAAILSLLAAAAVQAADSTAFRFTPPALTGLDSLFIIAATGEPRFKSLRNSVQKRLVAGDTATLTYLLANRLTGQTPRQRHYVEALFKAISDSGRNHAPVTALAAALSGAADSIQTQLLRIGSELGDTTFLPVARKYMDDDSVEVRKHAVRSLGTYPAPANVALLFKDLDKTRDLERQQRLWALGKQPGLKEWARLLPLLEDANLYNRQLVRQIVAKSIGGDWALLEPHIPKEMDEEEELEWILLALETPGQAAKAYVRKTLPLLEPAQRKFIESTFPKGGIGDRLRAMGPYGPAGPPGLAPKAPDPKKP